MVTELVIVLLYLLTFSGTAVLLWAVKTIGEKIMSQISDLIDRQTAAFNRTDTALVDLAEDIQTLIDASTTPADVAAVSANVVRSEAQAATVEALAARTANPPPPPPPPPTP